MPGEMKKQSTMLSPEERIPADHPLRRVKDWRSALRMLSDTFDAMYSQQGRPSPSGATR